MEEKIDKILANQETIKADISKIKIGLYGDNELKEKGAIEKANVAYSFTKKAKWTIRIVWGAIVSFFTWLMNDIFS